MLNKSNVEHDIDDDDDSMIHSGGGDDNGEIIIQQSSNNGNKFCGFIIDIIKDLYHSSGLVMNNKLNWLLLMGPFALLGDATGLLGETACFALSGIALIPCAER